MNYLSSFDERGAQLAKKIPKLGSSEWNHFFPSPNKAIVREVCPIKSQSADDLKTSTDYWKQSAGWLQHSLSYLFKDKEINYYDNKSHANWAQTQIKTFHMLLQSTMPQIYDPLFTCIKFGIHFLLWIQSYSRHSSVSSSLGFLMASDTHLSQVITQILHHSEIHCNSLSIFSGQKPDHPLYYQTMCHSTPKQTIWYKSTQRMID